LLTHGHFDHIGAAESIAKRFNVTIQVHQCDERLLKRSALYSSQYIKKIVVAPTRYQTFNNDTSFNLAGVPINIIPTPGHTRGGVCFLLNHFLFTGDTVLYRHIGPSRPPDGDFSQLKISVQNLLDTTPTRSIILPGHGRPWTIGEAQDWWKAMDGKPTSLAIFEGD